MEYGCGMTRRCRKWRGEIRPPGIVQRVSGMGGNRTDDRGNEGRRLRISQRIDGTRRRSEHDALSETSDDVCLHARGFDIQRPEEYSAEELRRYAVGR